ncbi:MAG: hypothetical protein K2H85_04665, partial [Allobaculum sp.]|nr:hypothetical protein [Allobaculum sp.]
LKFFPKLFLDLNNQKTERVGEGGSPFLLFPFLAFRRFPFPNLYTIFYSFILKSGGFNYVF